MTSLTHRWLVDITICITSVHHFYILYGFIDLTIYPNHEIEYTVFISPLYWLAYLLRGLEKRLFKLSAIQDFWGDPRLFVMPLNNMIQRCMGMEGRGIWEEVGCQYDQNALYTLLEEQTKVKGEKHLHPKKKKGKEW